MKTLPKSTGLTTAVETLSGRMHRRVTSEEGTNHVIGIICQVPLIEFLRENRSTIPIIDQLYLRVIDGLRNGSHELILVSFVKTGTAPQPDRD